MAIKATAITVTLTAIDSATGKRKTGDSANISVRLIKDGTSGARNDATAISETDATNCPGEYTVVLDATDTNANVIVVTGKSATSNIEIIPVKIITEQGTIAAIDTIIDDIHNTDLPAVKTDTAAILVDTGTTLDTLIKDIPTVAEFEARTILSASYALEATLTTLHGHIDDILADTNELQAEFVNGGRLDLLIDSIITHLTDIKGATWTNQTLELVITNIATRLASASYTAPDNTGIGNALTQATEANTHAHSIESKVDTIDTIIDDLHGTDIPAIKTDTAAIKLKTDNLPASPSSLTAQQVWEYATRTVSSYGTLVADIATAVWGAVSRTLTSGGSLTAQETRDAMKLAPSAGDPAADSIDDKIDTISVTMSPADLAIISDAVVDALGTPASQSSVDSLTTMLTGQEITVISPLIDAGTIEVVSGDTYNPDKASRLIRFKNTGSWSNLLNSTITIEWTGAGTATCELVTSGGPTVEQSFDVPLSSANTTAMLAGPFRIYATWVTPADVETLVIGQIVKSGPVL